MCVSKSFSWDYGVPHLALGSLPDAVNAVARGCSSALLCAEISNREGSGLPKLLEGTEHKCV